MPPQPQLQRIMEHRATLSRAEARTLMQQILGGQLSDLEIAALLGALSARGETPAEIAGFVDAMRLAATPLPLTELERSQLVDTCGTGADASGTFNISTAAALVAAAAGAAVGIPAATANPSAAASQTAAASLMVAKHGNRAVTSQCGSADVLEALGIPVNLPPPQAAQALRQHRFAFLHAPAHHPAMKAVMPVRRALGLRTVFNILGPLTNPAGASSQVMGVYAPHLVPLVAQAMALLGTRHAFVVHGETGPTDAAQTGATPTGHKSGLDELSISGPTHLAEVRSTPETTTPANLLPATPLPTALPPTALPPTALPPSPPGPGTLHPTNPLSAMPPPITLPTVTLTTITPEQFGLTRAPIEALAGGDANTNAAILRAIFRGEPGPPRDVVLLNAAAVLVTAGLAQDLTAGIHLAARAIDTGRVTELMVALARIN